MAFPVYVVFLPNSFKIEFWGKNSLRTLNEIVVAVDINFILKSKLNENK